MQGILSVQRAVPRCPLHRCSTSPLESLRSSPNTNRGLQECVCVLRISELFLNPRVFSGHHRGGSRARNMLTCLTRAPLLGLSTLSTPCTPSNSVRMDATFAHDNPFTILGVDLVCSTSVTIYPCARHHVLCTFSDRHMLRPFAHRRTAQMTMCAPPSEIRREHCIPMRTLLLRALQSSTASLLHTRISPIPSRVERRLAYMQRRSPA